MWRILNKYNFQIDSNLIIDLTCVICKKIVKDCRQSLCGCRYCCECIEDYLGGQDKLCPGSTEECRDQFIDFSIDIQIDHVANMKVSRIVVKCPESDCQHRDELRYIGDHINLHNMNCSYFEVGCDLSNINIDNHLKDDECSHSILLMNSLQQLKNELNSINEHSRTRAIITDTMITEIEHLRENCINQSEVIETYETEISKLSRELDNLKKCYETNEKLVIELLQQVEAEDDDYEIKFEELKVNIEGLERKKKSVRSNSIIQGSNAIPSTNSPFIWKIANLSMRRREANGNTLKYILSDSFYTASGYKLCLVVWPDGCKSSQRKYLPVGFHIMLGRNDWKLEWPMMSTVTISLIDQENSHIYRSVKYHYNSTPIDEKYHFNRPTVKLNKSERTRCFISFDELLTNRNLYRNDSIILICSADESS